MNNKDKVDVICSICGNKYQVKYETYRRNGKENHEWKCRKCAFTSMDDESKQKHSEKIKNALALKTDEEKALMISKRLKTISSDEFKINKKKKVQDTWKNKSKEELDRISNKASINTKLIWDNMSNEAKEKRKQLLANNFKEWFNNLDDCEKEELSKKYSIGQRLRWDSMTEDEKILYGHKSKEWYNNLSDKEKAEYNTKRANGIKMFWKNVDKQYKVKTANVLNSGRKEWWKNLNDTDKSDYIRSIISVSSNGNKLTLLFETKLNELNINYSKEFVTKNISTHCWDYALFNGSSLIMLIDVDGSFYHADKCDYDGLHSKEEYDEQRGLSIPDGVKWCIINEDKFDECVKYFISILNITYEDFIKLRFKEYQSIPFPQPHYSDKELLKSFDYLQRMNCNDNYHTDIKLNTRLGDRIIQHFHISLYDEAQAVWKDDNKLIKLIYEHAMYQSYLNKNKILQGLNVSKICNIKRFISPAKAKMIINKYLNEYNEIFNPDNKYSGILLGTISLKKKYIGFEKDDTRKNESNNIIEFLKSYGLNINAEINPTMTNKYVCLFTVNKNQEDIDSYIKTFHCEKYVFYNEDTSLLKIYEGGICINEREI